MKRVLVGKWLSIMSLCLVLLALPVALGACSLFGNISAPYTIYTANGSVQYPYSLEVSEGACTAWRVVLYPGWGTPLCASSLPTQQLGMYIRVSCNGISQLSPITSIDTKNHVVYLQ